MWYEPGPHQSLDVLTLLSSVRHGSHVESAHNDRHLKDWVHGLDTQAKATRSSSACHRRWPLQPSQQAQPQLRDTACRSAHLQALQQHVCVDGLPPCWLRLIALLQLLLQATGTTGCRSCLGSRWETRRTAGPEPLATTPRPAGPLYLHNRSARAPARGGLQAGGGELPGEQPHFLRADSLGGGLEGRQGHGAARARGGKPSTRVLLLRPPQASALKRRRSRSRPRPPRLPAPPPLSWLEGVAGPLQRRRAGTVRARSASAEAGPAASSPGAPPGAPGRTKDTMWPRLGPPKAPGLRTGTGVEVREAGGVVDRPPGDAAKGAMAATAAAAAGGAGRPGGGAGGVRRGGGGEGRGGRGGRRGAAMAAGPAPSMWRRAARRGEAGTAAPPRPASLTPSPPRNPGAPEPGKGRRRLPYAVRPGGRSTVEYRLDAGRAGGNSGGLPASVRGRRGGRAHLPVGGTAGVTPSRG